MKKVALIFPTIMELIDFELQIESTGYHVDRRNFTLTGVFTSREIEMAVNAFKASLVEFHTNENE